MTRERALKRYLSPLTVCVLATCAILSAAQGAATDLAENASTGTRAMAIIKVSADKRHFVREGTDTRFIAWGFNYDRDY